MHGATHRQAATRVPARIKTIRLALVAAMLVAGVGMSQASMARAAEFTVSVDDIAALTGLTAVVAHSGDGVNVRASASAGAEIIGTLADGEVVALRVDAVDTVLDGDGTRWWPVSAGGRDGWIAGFYLDSASGAPASTDGASAPDASSAAPEFSNGQRVAVRTDDGGGLVMRAGPSSAEDRIAVLGDGDVVQIVDGPFFDGAGSAWFKITDGDTTAYVFGAFLTAADQLPASTGQPAPEAAAFAVNDYVAPASGSVGVNVRKRAALSGKFIGSLAEGTVAQVVDGPAFDADGSAWYGVASGSIQGYALGDLLQASKAPAAAAPAAPAAPPAPKTGPTGSFMYPLSSYVFTQGFGCTIYDFEPYDANLGCPFHNGIDLAAPAYTPIMAADGGVVTAAGWCDCGLGYYVEIDHQNGFSTVYGHMAEQPYVAVGQAVNKGDVIGPLGSTGASTGPHTHFMIKLNGVPVDPLGYL